MATGSEAIARRLTEEVWNQGNLSVLDELVAADHTQHLPGAPPVAGRDGYRQMYSMYHTAFPDLQFTVEDLFAAGDRAVIRWTVTGAHRGDYETPIGRFAPTGKVVTGTGIGIVRIADGKVAESWTEFAELRSRQETTSRVGGRGLARESGKV